MNCRSSLPKFSAQALEGLRQALETGEVTVARANHHVTYPARFQLVAAMTPCRRGGGRGLANASGVRDVRRAIRQGCLGR